MRVYLDMCCYNRPYDPQDQLKVSMETQSKLYIQALIRQRKLDLVGSYILDYEVSQNPFEDRKNTISNFLYEQMQAYVGVERREYLLPMAASMMETGIKEKDAFHVASAIYAKCTYFISTDYRLLKYRTDQIRMVTPIEFVIETEGKLT